MQGSGAALRSVTARDSLAGRKKWRPCTDEAGRDPVLIDQRATYTVYSGGGATFKVVESWQLECVMWSTAYGGRGPRGPRKPFQTLQDYECLCRLEWFSRPPVHSKINYIVYNGFLDPGNIDFHDYSITKLGLSLRPKSARNRLGSLDRVPDAHVSLAGSGLYKCKGSVCKQIVDPFVLIPSWPEGDRLNLRRRHV